MSELLTDWISAYVIIAMIAFIGWQIFDGVYFTMAIWKVFVGRVSMDEWFDQPNRTRIGSGLRLYRKFKDR